MGCLQLTSVAAIPPTLRTGPIGSKRPDLKGRWAEQGFTLLELLVVLAILGLLIYLVGPKLMTTFGTAKHKVASLAVENLAQQLDMYRLDTGAYPSTEQGLEVLVTKPNGVATWNGPYVSHGEDDLKDPWGRPYVYHNPSKRAGHGFDIESLGADGRPGGDGEDADIVNK